MRTSEHLYDNYLSNLHRLPDVDKSQMRLRAPFIDSLIRNYFPKERSAKILDLGCGSGGVIQRIREKGYADVIGVDVSRETVAKASAAGILGVFQGDLTQWLRSLENSSQDVVLSLDVLEHFSKSEALSLAESVQRVLKPGGRWLITVPNGSGLFGLHTFCSDFTHETLFSPQSMKQLLRSVGFSNNVCLPIRPNVHGVYSLVRSILWFGFERALSLALLTESGSTKNVIFTRNFLTVAVKVQVE